MSRPNSAVKRTTSAITHRIAGVLVLTTLGLPCGSPPGSRRMTPVELATASTPESASTMDTKLVQLNFQSCESGWTWCHASPRCGSPSAASRTTTIAVGIATAKASPPVCLGPNQFNAPMPAMARAANFSGCGTPRYWKAESALSAAVTM